MSTLRYLPRAVWNGRIVAINEVRVSALGDGFMFGHGLFETIKVLRGQLVFFGDHFARLSRSAGALGLSLASNRESLQARCAEAIAANGLVDGNLKVMLFEDYGGAGEVVLAREGLYPAEFYARGFRLKTETSGARGMLAGHKSLNYFENIAAKRRVVTAGFDEPVWVDAAGELLEGATTNIFAVVGGVVLTPLADGRILPGVVRGQVLRLLPGHAVEAPLMASVFAEAQEVFVTNALLGVMPVSQVDERRFDLSNNPITRRLQIELATAADKSMSGGYVI